MAIGQDKTRRTRTAAHFFDLVAVDLAADHGTEGHLAAEFVRPGPRDKQGRSLREFDLTRRMFEYPCSYLVYSPSLLALPTEAKDYVFRRLEEVLSGQDQGEKFQHLSVADRAAIREILQATHPRFQPMKQVE